jgi:hypothetical protein
MLIGRQTYWRYKLFGMWSRATVDISMDHSATIFRVNPYPLLTFLQTTLPSSSEWSHATVDISTDHSAIIRHKFWATLMWEFKLYCYPEGKRHPARRYEDWGLSKTMAVAFTLFQCSAYKQVKIIQSHGVWVSPLTLWRRVTHIWVVPHS